MFTFAEYLTMFFSFVFVALLFYFPIKWFIKWSNAYKKNKAIRKEEKRQQKLYKRMSDFYSSEEGQKYLEDDDMVWLDDLDEFYSNKKSED